MLCGMWDLKSLSDQILALCIERWSLNHWTAREVPEITFFFFLTKDLSWSTYISISQVFKYYLEGLHFHQHGTSLVAQLVKNLPAM